MTTIKFNAGRVQYQEDTKKCTPLPHKGTITIKPSSDEEGFYDFTWAPKTSSGLEKDELLIIPGDVSFKQVSCKTGRVFALTFLSSGAKYLYWLQDIGDDEELDKLTEKDKQLVKKIQDIIVVEDDEPEQPEEPSSSEPVAQVKQEAQYPILEFEDAFPFEVLEAHINELSDEEFQHLVNENSHDLPEFIRSNPTKSNFLSLMRSGFFQQSKSNLSNHFRSPGSGYLLANLFKLEYNGEGINNFLKSVRDRKT